VASRAASTTRPYETSSARITKEIRLRLICLHRLSLATSFEVIPTPRFDSFAQLWNQPACLSLPWVPSAWPWPGATRCRRTRRPRLRTPTPGVEVLRGLFASDDYCRDGEISARELHAFSALAFVSMATDVDDHVSREEFMAWGPGSSLPATDPDRDRQGAALVAARPPGAVRLSHCGFVELCTPSTRVLRCRRQVPARWPKHRTD
jgi:hypothetical protein